MLQLLWVIFLSFVIAQMIKISLYLASKKKIEVNVFVVAIVLLVFIYLLPSNEVLKLQEVKEHTYEIRQVKTNNVSLSQEYFDSRPDNLIGFDENFTLVVYSPARKVLSEKDVPFNDVEIKIDPKVKESYLVEKKGYYKIKHLDSNIFYKVEYFLQGDFISSNRKQPYIKTQYEIIVPE